MVTGPDGSEKLLLAEILERKIRDDPEKYYTESWDTELKYITGIIIATIIAIIINYVVLPTEDDIWYTLAFLGNATWAIIVIVYMKRKSIKEYKLLYPEKYNESHL